MDAIDVIKVCLKRWYVMAPVVLLAIAVGVGFAQQVRPTYTASGTYAVIYKNTDKITAKNDPRDKNPLGSNGGALLGEALQSAYMSGPYQKRFGNVGTAGTGPGDPANGTSYGITLPQDSQSYVVQAWGHDPAEVKKVVDGVLGSSAATASSIQDRAGAPRDSKYTTFTTSSAQVSKLATSSAAKVVIAVSGLGVLAGASFAVMADAVLRRRRRSRDHMGEAAGPIGSADGPDVAGPDAQRDIPAVGEERIDDDHRSEVPPATMSGYRTERRLGAVDDSDLDSFDPSDFEPRQIQPAGRGFAGRQRGDLG